MRFIYTPINVIEPPFGGPNPPYHFFQNYKKLKRAQKVPRNKRCRSQKVDKRNFSLGTISLQIPNLRFLKTSFFVENQVENKGTRIFFMYSKNGCFGGIEWPFLLKECLLGRHRMTIFIMIQTIRSKFNYAESSDHVWHVTASVVRWHFFFSTFVTSKTPKPYL